MDNAVEFLERACAVIIFCLAAGLLFLELSGLDKLLAVRVAGRMFRIIILEGGTI